MSHVRSAQRVPRLPRRTLLVGLAAGAMGGLVVASPADAASAAELDAQASTALAQLYASSPRARELGARARAILIFPKITKAGLMIGGQNGEGVLRVGRSTVGYYRITAASFGLQAGAQKFGYALFFITQSSLDYLKKADGWAIGSGPSVVIVDEGFARTMNTTTLTQDVYAMAFQQRGLMAGLGLEGSKITRITPD